MKVKLPSWFPFNCPSDDLEWTTATNVKRQTDTFVLGRPMHNLWHTACGMRIAGAIKDSRMRIELNWKRAKLKRFRKSSENGQRWNILHFASFIFAITSNTLSHTHTHSISHRTATFIQPPFHYVNLIAAMLIGSQYKSFTFIEVFSLLASHFWFMKHNLVFCFSQQQQQQQQQVSLLFCVRRTESDTI